MPTLSAYITQHKDRFLRELEDFLKIPSIGANPGYQEETRQAAHFVERALRTAGAEKVRLLETAGQPIVYGEKMLGDNYPTLLVYGHYDVQPTDPEELWETPPFSPTIRGGKIYARGASDDKGQLHAHFKAFEAMVATGQLPCNVKFLIEGEEEIGSPNITALFDDPKTLELIRADAILVSDTSMPAMDQPIVLTSLRGVVMVKINVTGPSRDLHSGVHGGAVANPINALCALIAQLKDDQQRITIPGFYDGIPPLSEGERAIYKDPHFKLEAYEKDLGIPTVAGEAGYTTTERIVLRPCLDVNGIWGGTLGQVKTVLPSKAHALISMRIVHGQDARKIGVNLRKYIEALALQLPALRGTTVEVEPLHHQSNALKLSPRSKAIEALIEAYQKSWGGAVPRITGEGASIPILTTMYEKAGVPIALLGFGLDSDNIHSPNEHLGLENYYKGIETIISFYHAYANK